MVLQEAGEVNVALMITIDDGLLRRDRRSGESPIEPSLRDVGAREETKGPFVGSVEAGELVRVDAEERTRIDARISCRLGRLVERAVQGAAETEVEVSGSGAEVIEGREVARGRGGGGRREEDGTVNGIEFGDEWHRGRERGGRERRV